MSRIKSKILSWKSFKKSKTGYQSWDEENIPHVNHGIPKCTEHPQRTDDIPWQKSRYPPQCIDDIPQMHLKTSQCTDDMPPMQHCTYVIQGDYFTCPWRGAVLFIDKMAWTNDNNLADTCWIWLDKVPLPPPPPPKRASAMGYQIFLCCRYHIFTQIIWEPKKYTKKYVILGE